MNQKNKKPRILLVEDETDIRKLIALLIERENMDFSEAGDGITALQSLKRECFDLAVLDWMLPGMDGIEITRWIRSQTELRNLPILMLTAKTQPEDIVVGLDAGADDYLTKPFEAKVLLARVRALLRRNQPSPTTTANPKENSLLRVGEIALDTEAFRASCQGKTIELTRSEFLLLKALMTNAGKVLTRNQLIDCVQGSDVAVIDRTIVTHVFGLRKKLGAFADFIETVRGIGYRVSWGE